MFAFAEDEPATDVELGLDAVTGAGLQLAANERSDLALELTAAILRGHESSHPNACAVLSSMFSISSP